MDCYRAKLVAILFAATIGSAGLGSIACAQRVGGARTAYNPVSGQTEPDTRYHKPLQSPSYMADDVEYSTQNGGVQQASYCACDDGACAECEVGLPYGDACGCGDVLCGDSVCGDAVCGDAIGCGPCLPAARWYAGFEATFVKPYFGQNTAFTVTDNTVDSTSITDANFDYDLEFTPRVFVGWNRCGNVGLRATWWQFDHGAKTASGSPPESGLGEITHPAFGDVDLSSTSPGDVFTAGTDLNAYTIDLEATKSNDFCGWTLGMGCGFRYAYAEQGYAATLAGDEGEAIGRIDYRQSIEGFGPTVSLDAYRPYGCRSGIFCRARGSVLFGDAKTRLQAEEDLSLTTPFTTTRATANDDVLSIGELQVGYRWHAAPVNCRPYQPFCSIAMEGQVWDGAGNSTSQDATLGFFGFNSAIGVNW